MLIRFCEILVCVDDFKLVFVSWTVLCPIVLKSVLYCCDLSNVVFVESDVNEFSVMCEESVSRAVGSDGVVWWLLLLL